MDSYTRALHILQRGSTQTTSTPIPSLGSMPPNDSQGMQYDEVSTSPPSIQLDVSSLLHPPQSTHPMITRSKAEIYKPKLHAAVLTPTPKDVEPIFPTFAFLCLEWN